VKIEVKSVKQHKKWGTINLIGCVRSTCTWRIIEGKKYLCRGEGGKYGFLAADMYVYPCVRIHKHFRGVEIPGFDLQTGFSGLTISLFLCRKYRIHRVIFPQTLTIFVLENGAANSNSTSILINATCYQLGHSYSRKSVLVAVSFFLNS
jgi:hypothetical protein